MKFWKAKKQTTISKSSAEAEAEAEYCTLASTTSELVWVNQLHRDFSDFKQRSYYYFL